MNIYRDIDNLIKYGLIHNLIDDRDIIYIRNRYLELLRLDDYIGPEHADDLPELHLILENIISYAIDNKIIESDDITTKDLFDTKLMGIMLPLPSQVIDTFSDSYASLPENATNWFYKFSQDTNYIRRDRIKKDKKWLYESQYGPIDITINLSKPEKDPRAIAAAKNAKQSSYPKCQLCMENEGYAGRMNHPARQNHRIIPITINGKVWGFQYSPYVYYNEHCIVFNREHVPMKIEEDTFRKMFSFLEIFPHYFIGSNADLPIVGGSILSHDHFQGGRYTFALERAQGEYEFQVKGYDNTKCEIVKWPMSVIRLTGNNPEEIIRLAVHILDKWRGYTDEEAFIFAETEGEPHNTITPIARRRGEAYQLDLALRNNITTEEHPLGVYHPHSEYHNIKKENIGLIEVMGLAILPARLKTELELMENFLVNESSRGGFAGNDNTAENDNTAGNDNFAGNELPEELEKHRAWMKKLIEEYGEFTGENVTETLQKEIGKVFTGVLENAGVFKCDPEGRNFFKRFLESL